VLQQFEEICPGAAQRILGLAEGEAAHRRSIEKKVMHGEIHTERFGMICALLVFAMFIAAGAYAIYLEQPIVGAIFGTFPIVGVLTVFIKGRRS
jgi:uncharacterized membrane protein